MVITEADYAKKKPVKKGDLIEVRLLAGLPLCWAQEPPNPALRSMLKHPRTDPAPRKGKFPSLDGRYICVNQFEFVGDSNAPVTLKLLYCAGE